MTLPLLVKPRLRLDPGALLPSSSFVQAAGLGSRLQTSYSHCHVSSFRSLLLDMQLYSPSIKTVKQAGLGGMISCPVFGDHDKVEGKVILGPDCSQNGRLNISIEGVFEYVSVKEDLDDESAQGPKTSKYRHIFLSSSAVIPISPIPDPFSVVCDVFGVSQLPGDSSLNGPASRSCEFSFEIPRGSRLGEEMPPTFCASIPCDNRRGSPSIVEKAEVSYRVTAVWEPLDMSETSGMLEVPILFHPDTDFQSIDGSNIAPELWLEMPLTPERCVPFHCAVTLPRPQSFSRRTSVPYFVVFTTKARCAILAREIAADATIAISLVRKITIKPQLPPTFPDTTQLSDDSDSPSGPFSTPRTKLLKRTPKPAGTAVVHVPKSPEEPFSAAVRYKPLPELRQAFSETHTLKTQVSVGFPKRPRHPNGSSGSESQTYLPDGLYKGKFWLSKDMIPGVDWPGVSVKYYLDVTVLFRQDALRACVPIRVF
ncbi:uncharacterized protein BJ212DRAFT_1325526 [Suillus subaureus]|uniref:Uncharacterized protein n=1 Tax=Suillus subaureus TaxID=48587 RepID=A0A9P7EJA0_9AGAM|nr:uncharacterized protein BJ212DRAFT_1325526 [Suillus subaureus]KAG1823613.1 hypothetical protein BJ212DRAFT_1325526 [Suillus subaureus]